MRCQEPATDSGGDGDGGGGGGGGQTDGRASERTTIGAGAERHYFYLRCCYTRLLLRLPLLLLPIRRRATALRG